MLNLDGKQSKGTHWVSLVIDRNTAGYFDSFGIEYILPEVLSKIKDKSITHNIFRIQFDDSIMCRFYWIAFIEYMLAEKLLFDYTNLFSSNDYQNNDKIKQKYLKTNILKGNVSLEFRLKKIDKTRRYLLEEINICWALTYFSFSGYWLCFCFWICFISWYSCRYYKFWSSNKSSCNNCRN